MHPYVYDIIYTIAFILYCPLFLGKALFKKKNLINLKERFGFINIDSRKSNLGIWVHAVSVGEFISIKGLIRLIRQQIPDASVWVSTVTTAAYFLANKTFGKECFTFLFPFDWSFVIKRVIKQVNPDLIIVVESEFWPNFLYYCGKARIPLMIANGRLSERAFRRYKIFRSFFLNRLNSIKLFCMQTEADANRLIELGIDEGKIIVAGNVKYDIKPQQSGDAFYQVNAWLGEAQCILAASTMNGEEKLIFELYKRLRKDFSRLKLIIAPRHHERFDEVKKIIKQEGFDYRLRTENRTDQSDVFLLDTIGELASVIQLGTVVIMGGSIKPFGGHNIIEPAFFKRAIIVGEHMENFADIVNNFIMNKACVQVPFERFYDEVKDLLINEKKRQELGENAFKIVQKNMGVTENIFKYVLDILNLKPTS